MKLTRYPLLSCASLAWFALDCVLKKKIESCRVDRSCEEAWLVFAHCAVVEFQLEIFQYKGFEQPSPFYPLG